MRPLVLALLVAGALAAAMQSPAAAGPSDSQRVLDQVIKP